MNAPEGGGSIADDFPVADSLIQSDTRSTRPLFDFRRQYNEIISIAPEGEVAGDKKFYLFFKRVLDVFLSVTALIALLPVFAVTAVAIKLDSKGPVFYTQQRSGKHRKPFKIYKFRSMRADAELQLKNIVHLNEKDGPVFKIAHDPRVTRVGRFLRKTSIDELPQLLNIIRGDMSIVGPRPPLPNEVAQYSPHQMQRLNVKPGLTCFWAISGRSNLSFNEWVSLDLKYIREIGFITDFLIILKTIPAVLTCRGAY